MIPCQGAYGEAPELARNGFDRQGCAGRIVTIQQPRQLESNRNPLRIRSDENEKLDETLQMRKCDQTAESNNVAILSLAFACA